MFLADLLDIEQLRDLITRGYIRQQNHPTLPLAILNYSNECIFDNFWPEVVQHCRGLIVELAHNYKKGTDVDRSSTGLIPESTIVARPFHKFFNLNQSNQPDYEENNLPKVVPTVTEKMDGWFGSLWHYENQYGIASRGSFTSPGASFGTDKLGKLIKYGAIEEFPKGYTPIFEIIFKEGRIVVDYPYEGLVLLGLVNIETGEELPYDDLQAVWAKIAGYATDNRPWIRLVKAHRMTLNECTLASTQYLPSKDLSNKEGWVLSYPRPGTWPIKVKVKLGEYKRLHKLITGINPHHLWKYLQSPLAHWTEAEVPAHFREWSTEWRDKFYQDFSAKYEEAIACLLAVRRMTSLDNVQTKTGRSIVFNILQETYPETANVVMSMLDGKMYKAHRALWDSIEPKASDTFYKEGEAE